MRISRAPRARRHPTGGPGPAPGGGSPRREDAGPGRRRPPRAPARRAGRSAGSPARSAPGRSDHWSLRSETGPVRPAPRAARPRRSAPTPPSIRSPAFDRSGSPYGSDPAGTDRSRRVEKGSWAVVITRVPLGSSLGVSGARVQPAQAGTNMPQDALTSGPTRGTIRLPGTPRTGPSTARNRSSRSGGASSPVRSEKLL